jgi:hypothetical protein
MPFPRTEEELLAAGYAYETSRICSGPNCRQNVRWYRTQKGKRIPLDAGTLEPHWATCVDSAAFMRDRSVPSRPPAPRQYPFRKW